MTGLKLSPICKVTSVEFATLKYLFERRGRSQIVATALALVLVLRRWMCTAHRRTGKGKRRVGIGKKCLLEVRREMRCRGSR
jgi:hypothetical protein